MPSKEIVVYNRIDPVALFSVLLAGIALGAIAHEVVHVFLISQPTNITLHFGDPEVLLSTCCIKPGEEAFEWLAFSVQFIVLAAWVFLNHDLWLHEVRHEIRK